MNRDDPSALKWVSALTALTWPILVAAILVSRHSSVTGILAEVPAALSRSTDVEIGGVKFKINPSAVSEAPEDVKSALRGISSADIGRLLAINDNEYHYGPHGDVNKGTDNELVRRRLMSKRYETEVTVINNVPVPGGNEVVKLTPLGERTLQFLVEILARAINAQ